MRYWLCLDFKEQFRLGKYKLKVQFTQCVVDKDVLIFKPKVCMQLVWRCTRCYCDRLLSGGMRLCQMAQGEQENFCGLKKMQRHKRELSYPWTPCEHSLRTQKAKPTVGYKTKQKGILQVSVWVICRFVFRLKLHYFKLH